MKNPSLKSWDLFLGVKILDFSIHGQSNSCDNFAYYLGFQLSKKSENKILIAYEKKYLLVIDKLRQSLNKDFEIIGIHDISEDQTRIFELYPQCDRALFFYDHFTRKDLQPGYSEEMKPYARYFSEDPLKVIFINDMLEQFNQVFSIKPKRIQELNNKLIDLAKQSKNLEITDNIGTLVNVDLRVVTHWSSIDGTTFGEIIPGEIASYSPEFNGTLCFTGSFLSMIPIGIKHGVIVDPIQFIFKKSRVHSFHCNNSELSKDLNYFFEFSDDHAHIHEIGIGTNEGITKLYGKNASFEEKHVGIHFGLGGKEDGTFHLDMMMQDSIFKFDNQLIFDGSFKL